MNVFESSYKINTCINIERKFISIPSQNKQQLLHNCMKECTETQLQFVLKACKFPFNVYVDTYYHHYPVLSIHIHVL